MDIKNVFNQVEQDKKNIENGKTPIGNSEAFKALRKRLLKDEVELTEVQSLKAEIERLEAVRGELARMAAEAIHNRDQRKRCIWYYLTDKKKKAKIKEIIAAAEERVKG